MRNSKGVPLYYQSNYRLTHSVKMVEVFSSLDSLFKSPSFIKTERVRCVTWYSDRFKHITAVERKTLVDVTKTFMASKGVRELIKKYLFAAEARA